MSGLLPISQVGKHNNKRETVMQVKELLEQACKTGEYVEIVTERSIYTDALVFSCGETAVEFSALHPLKEIEYDFEVDLSKITAVNFY